MHARFFTVILVLTLWGVPRAVATAEPLSADIEFFEKQVRPILADVCQKCHGANKQEAGLRLDSRAAAIQGGDSGGAIVPKMPEKSRLIDAIRYTGELRMPPKGKLPDEQIAILSEWVRRGAPWPVVNAAPAVDAREEFDLAGRKARQWAFQPIVKSDPPRVRNPNWATSPIDLFLLARLEAANLQPGRPADKRSLLRRVTFDLIGIPPSPAEIESFLADNSPRALEGVIDRLLASPHYGERWGRHWLDLVRFAETSGHEFDFEIPLAWEYRDYVIRAFNADVPYDQFVVEHVAGDLVKSPRRHPTERINESVIATGFWFLGESKHSPVDIRADEAERFDNQIDVFGKAFLAQTLGCARCHDHKFDAISTKDYYALSGFLQSSRFQLACIDPLEDRLAIVGQLQQLAARLAQERTTRLAAVGKKPAVGVGEFLLAALAVLDPTIPLVPPAEVTATDEFVFEDFEKPTYAGWTAKGTAFGEVPNRRPLPEYQGEIGALGKGFVNSHSALSRQGTRTATDELTGTLTSGKFKIDRTYIHYLIGGGAHAGKTCLNLSVGGKVARTATGKNNNRLDWSTFDVRELSGQEAFLEIVDQERGGWGNIGVDQIVFSNNPVPGGTGLRIAAAAARFRLPAEDLTAWVTYLKNVALPNHNDPFHLWAALGSRAGSTTAGEFNRFRSEMLQAQTAIADRLKTDSDGYVLFENFSQSGFAGWLASGEAFGTGPVQAGSRESGFSIAIPAGSRGRGIAHSAGLSHRLQGALRSQTFTIEKPRIVYHAAGAGTNINLIIDSFQQIRAPIYGGLTIAQGTPDRFQWFVQDVSKWVGHAAYIELIDAGDGFIAVDEIGFTDKEPPAESPNSVTVELLSNSQLNSPEDLAQAYQRLATGDSAEKPLPQESASAGTNRLMATLAASRLPGTAAHTLAASEEFKQTLAQLDGERQQLETRIRYQRKAPTLTDGTSEDDHVHLRGSPHRMGDVVPRRFLEAVAGVNQPALTEGSGRMELARRMVDPSNPLLARVIVNRLWKHHFGEGLVPTPDDFGNMGQPPTHPELLDWLAAELMERRWSLKSLHRLLLLSSAYQMSSRADDPVAEEADPQNKLWHRMNLRRLEAESIRDAMLAVSGRSDRRQFGPPVAPYLTPFMIGRGRPAQSGPLDGDGRRSIYLNVRRNFLNPMFLAFDYPVPFATIGRRSESNVPAQALSLMNNPFVLSQAEVWARRILAEYPQPDPVARIRAMYLTAFARSPSPDELETAVGFVALQSRLYPAEDELHPWSDLAHVLFNVKEFIFVD